ncbi:unnamed protein product [Darwinula stevensoni]|uniref:FAS1 domain-containing protein n=1 Tax=Darwinula stevensoni TaxID=69355 RepID=A0A7R9A2I6_9CRUS|nr:unnamed protein product [Darwinula stevensoni]CAG0880024.1 unnamed protein product [Darwinula stevensoni]
MLRARGGEVSSPWGQGPYTIFAPTDEAFNRLPGGIQQSLQEDPELLRRTLLYHISPGVREARALRNEIRVDTLVSDKQLTVRIYADKKPTVNSAVLTVPDARGSNGIVHIVSDVIYPIPEGDLWKTLESCNAFSSFAKLVREAELEDILSNTEKEEKWTIFVPVNAAFLLDESDKNDTNSLRELVRSHMVLGSHYSASLRDGLILYSVSAAATELEVGVRNGKLREVNIGRVLKADIPATNGVIHAIDRILLLPSIC